MPRPKTEALEEVYERLSVARGILLNALWQLKIDASPLQEPAHAWREALEAFKKEAQTVHDDASNYYDRRSEGWQEADEGQAFAKWMQELHTLTEFDGWISSHAAPIAIVIDLADESPYADFEVNPDELLAEPPEIPELEE
jgi:hypothetical protein